MDTEVKLVDLAKNGQAEDFKTAIQTGLAERMRSNISDQREALGASVFGENMGHIQTDEKKSGDKTATAPTASGGTDTGHQQTDEKKTGKKKATAPGGVKEAFGKSDDDDGAKDEDHDKKDADSGDDDKKSDKPKKKENPFAKKGEKDSDDKDDE